MPAWRRLVTVALSCVEVVLPSVKYLMPPAPPQAQKSVPFVVTALRGLLAVAKSVSAVVVSTVPAASIRPILRGTAVAAVPLSDVAPPVFVA